jgi:hypothetical protein
MVKACFICGAKDVRLFEIPSNMEQRQKWFEAFETFCGKQIYVDNDKDNLLICMYNIRHYKNYGLDTPKDDAYVKMLFLLFLIYN